MTHRLRIFSVLLLAPLFVWASPAPGEDNKTWLADGRIRLTNVVPGMLFTADGVGVVVPPPGTQVGAEALLETGSTVTFIVETAPDGSVFLQRDPVMQLVAQRQSGDQLVPALPEEPSPDAMEDDPPSVPLPEPIGTVVQEGLEDLGLDRAPSPQPTPRHLPVPAALPNARPQPHGSAAEQGVTVEATALGACADGAHSLAGPKWAKTFKWYLYTGSKPSNLALTAVESALKRSVTHLVGGYNNCRLADAISATATYAGRTTTQPDINSSAGCSSSDNKSELGFGPLPTGYAGMACWWSSGGDISEGDVKFNRGAKWYLTKPSVCLSQWSVEAAAAHELGHVFGLNHVSELEHGALTMAPKIMACQASEITLGLGDVRGLEALYGPTPLGGTDLLPTPR